MPDHDMNDSPVATPLPYAAAVAALGRKAANDTTLRQRALDALCLADADAKLAATRSLQADAERLGDSLPAGAGSALAEPPSGLPGRPARPLLVAPQEVPRRPVHTADGRAALLHAVCHIEFNAINLALDAVWRFGGLPTAYYRDWVGVAAEEAVHFGLLQSHLRTLGCAYGDFAAHDGLWRMVERTAHDPIARMNLVPRTLEARGLDATPPMRAKLAQAGDMAAAAILDIILRDEIGHVAIGNRWYRWLCARDGLDPEAHDAVLADCYRAPRSRPPFNLVDRASAGFTTSELASLQRSV